MGSWDALQAEIGVLSISEFSKFCRDFGLFGGRLSIITTQDARTLFFSSLRAESNQITFAQFMEILSQIAAVAAACDTTGGAADAQNPGTWFLQVLESADMACNRAGIKSILQYRELVLPESAAQSGVACMPGQEIVQTLYDTLQQHNALHMIFKHYARSETRNKLKFAKGANQTRSQLLHDSERMSLTEFNVLCREFGLFGRAILSTHDAKNLFHAILEDSQEQCDYAQFLTLLAQIVAIAQHVTSDANASDAAIWLLRNMNQANKACTNAGVKSIL